MEKSNNIQKKNYPHGQAAKLEKNVKETYLFVIIGAILLLLFAGSNIYLSRVSKEQLQDTMYLNQYRLASKTLTASVQSYAVTGDKTYYDNYMKELNDDKNRDIAWNGLKKNNLKSSEWAKLNEIANLSNGLVPTEEKAMEKAGAGDTEAATALVFGSDYENVVAQINDDTNSCINEIQSRMSKKQMALNIVMYVSMALFIVAFVLIIRRIILTMKFSEEELLSPIVKVSDQMKELAEGKFDNNMDLVEDESEVGDMVASINFMNKNFKDMISEIAATLGEMGDGNYNVSLTHEYVGEFEKIKESLLQIISDTKETLSTIQSSAREIGSGSEQLAQAATDLAEGCTSQANKISEASGMIDDMTDSMIEKAEDAKQTARLSTEAAKVVETGNAKMQELKAAISEINDRSEEISSIISVIEDIAVQTNLLSLNASIEAARAGEAGKGFAVVAEQVKNLAEQSTKAAGETTALIQASVEAVKKGIVLADETEANMDEVMSGAKESTDKMIHMAETLQHEVDNIKKIDENISHVAEIVDNNSASSEETAAISEEQSAQVQLMVQMMEKFRI